MTYCLKYACVSKNGRRKNNQDNLNVDGFFLEKDHFDSPCLMGNLPLKLPHTFCVFDGLGGECEGETASFMAAKDMSVLSGQIHEKTNPFMIKKAIGTICYEINQKICDYAAMKKYNNMGCTLAGVTFFEDRIYGYNLGDSRIYHFSGGKLKQSSRDHVASGTFYHTGLTQYLGIPEKEFVICPDIFSEEVRENDCYLICSDGLYSQLCDTVLEDILLSYPSPETALNHMMAEVEEMGMADNTSAIIIQIVKE